MASLDAAGVTAVLAGFSEHTEDAIKFRSSLTPLQDPAAAKAGPLTAGSDSLVRVLLGVSALQPRLITLLLERLPEFSLDDDSAMVAARSEDASMPHLILAQVTTRNGERDKRKKEREGEKLNTSDILFSFFFFFISVGSFAGCRTLWSPESWLARCWR